MRSLLETDRRLYVLCHSRLRARALDPIMVWMTKAGTKGVLWLGIAAGMSVDSHGRARWVALVSVAALLAAEGLINLVLKPVIRRERPYTRPGLASLLVRAPGAYSWPSAHAGSSVAAAGVLSIAYPALGVLFMGIALLIGYSRIYVGVHYPMDVITGMLVGALCAAVTSVIGGLLPLPGGL